jgi:hypothetical protein
MYFCVRLWASEVCVWWRAAYKRYTLRRWKDAELISLFRSQRRYRASVFLTNRAQSVRQLQQDHTLSGGKVVQAGFVSMCTIV